MKVATILGTRPEIIRLSRVMAALDRYTEHVIIHTGQNYDYELNQIFFDDWRSASPIISWKPPEPPLLKPSAWSSPVLTPFCERSSRTLC